MLHKFDPREQELYIKITTAILDAVMEETSFEVIPLYATGGTVRRLNLIKNGCIHKEDLWALFQSDFDFHSSSYNRIGIKQKPSKLWFCPVFNKTNPYDGYGICDFNLGINRVRNNRDSISGTHVIDDIMPLMLELEPYRMGLAKELNKHFYGIVNEITNITIQFIANKSIDHSLIADDFAPSVLSRIDLKFDIAGCSFLYRDGEIYDNRLQKSEDLHSDFIDISVSYKSPLKTLRRVRKMERFGYKYDRSNIEEFIQMAIKEKEKEGDSFFSDSNHSADTEYGGNDTKIVDSIECREYEEHNDVVNVTSIYRIARDLFVKNVTGEEAKNMLAFLTLSTDDVTKMEHYDIFKAMPESDILMFPVVLNNKTRYCGALQMPNMVEDGPRAYVCITKGVMLEILSHSYLRPLESLKYITSQVRDDNPYDKADRFGMMELYKREVKSLLTILQGNIVLIHGVDSVSELTANEIFDECGEELLHKISSYRTELAMPFTRGFMKTLDGVLKRG